jgi:hypothetical protein
LIILEQREIISEDSLDELLDQLDFLCRQITNFQKALKELTLCALLSSLCPVIIAVNSKPSTDN